MKNNLKKMGILRIATILIFMMGAQAYPIGDQSQQLIVFRNNQSNGIQTRSRARKAAALVRFETFRAAQSAKTERFLTAFEATHGDLTEAQPENVCLVCKRNIALYGSDNIWHMYCGPNRDIIHLFHCRCIAPHLEQFGKCPYCSKPIYDGYVQEQIDDEDDQDQNEVDAGDADKVRKQLQRAYNIIKYGSCGLFTAVVIFAGSMAYRAVP